MLTIPTNRALFRVHQTADYTQEACLAASIGAGKLDARSRRQSKTDVAEQPAITAHASHVFDFQNPHLKSMRQMPFAHNRKDARNTS